MSLLRREIGSPGNEEIPQVKVLLASDLAFTSPILAGIITWRSYTNPGTLSRIIRCLGFTLNFEIGHFVGSAKEFNDYKPTEMLTVE